GQRQQAQELGHPLLLAVNPFGAHENCLQWGPGRSARPAYRTEKKTIRYSTSPMLKMAVIRPRTTAAPWRSSAWSCSHSAAGKYGWLASAWGWSASVMSVSRLVQRTGAQR